MSVSSTRSGRIVKLKCNADEENISGHTDNHSHGKMTKSLSTTNTNKGRSPKTKSADTKLPKNTPPKYHHQDNKETSVKKPSHITSLIRGGSAKPKQVTDSIMALSPAEIIENNVAKSPVTASPLQNKTGDKEPPTPSSAVRRSGRAPVPSSRYKDMELDLTWSRKRLISSSEELVGERAKRTKITSDRSAPDLTNLGHKSASHAGTQEPLKSSSATVVIEEGNIPLSVEEMIQNNLSESELQIGKRTVKTISSKSAEAQMAIVSEQTASSPIVVSETEVVKGAVQKTVTAFPSIQMDGQHLTFTEHDGETVTVLTIPSSSGKDDVNQELETPDSSSEDQCISFEVVESDKEKKNLSGLVTLNPTAHGLRHVTTRDLEAPFATVVGQDGAAYLNLSVEATKISSILKGKHVTTKPSNPVKGHGRVLRSPMGSMIVRTTLVPPRISQQDISETKPTMTYSLLYPKKPLTEESTHLISETIPVTVMSGQVSQTPQRIVIRQQPSQKSPVMNVSQVGETKSNENLLTVSKVSQELPNKSIVTSAQSTSISSSSTTTMPKTASEILLQKLKLQSKQAVLNESNVLQKETSESGTGDAESCKTTDDKETSSQQVLLECVDGLNMSPVKQNDADSGEETSERSLLVEGSSEPEMTNTGENLSIITVTVDNLSKKTTADDSESPLTPNVLSCSRTSAPTKSESTEWVKNTSDTPTPSPQVVKGIDSNDVKPSISNESQSTTAESDNTEQKTVTKIVHITSSNKGTPTSLGKDRFIEKVRVVENGVEYDMRIVSEEEVAEEIIESAANLVLQKELKHSGSSTADVKPKFVIKQEFEDDSDTEDIKQEIEKQTSGTQTIYSSQVQSTTSVDGTIATTTHTLTAMVEEGSEKRQVYYVSVIPNKGIMTKSKTSMYSAANWVIDGNGMYCCEKCEYQTDRKANFYKHRRSHTGAKPHVCAVCQYKAGTSSNLKRHMGIHKDIREHKCDICSLCFRQKIHLERHIKYKHEEKSIKCPMCDYICANEQPDLKMHIKRKHSTDNSGETVTCPECKAQVGNRKDLKQHMKFHKDGPELKLFCKECSFVTDCQSRLKRHIAIHSKMKPFQCGVCNYRAAQKEHVLRHLRTQHKIDIKRDGKRPWRRHKKTATEDGSKERADFTSGDKIFACNHCTMRFAKLINLYKHLHTQHGDIMPQESDGNFYCVVCEFSTTNKKNLLVHMRRHNLTDQTPPTHVYSCVLCRYVNPRRRNLFQHMRKKHNISVSRQSDNGDGDDDGDSQEMEVSDIIGSVNRALTPNTNTVSVTSSQASDISSREMAGDMTNVASVIKIEDLTRMTSSGDNDDMQALVIDSRGADITEVVHSSTHSAEALEGLQALAEQAGLIDNIIEEQVPVLDEQQTIVLEHNGNTAEVVETVGGQLQHIIQSSETQSGEAVEGLELSEDQLSSLRHGDMVEMEGQLYLVELTQDLHSPNKQLLSFLPVTTTTTTSSMSPDHV